MPLTSIIFYRLFFGLCLIFIFLLFTKRLGDLKPGKRKGLLFLQGVFTAINMFFYFFCVKNTCFSVAILLEYTAPIYVMLASPLILKEKAGKESILALFLAISGVFLVINPTGGLGDFKYSGNYFSGILSGLFAGIFLAIIIMNIKILKRNYTELSIAFWGTAISCLLTIPFAFGTSFSALSLNLFALLAFGVVSVGFGGILNIIGFANLKSQTGSLLSLIEPVAGVFIDLVFLGVALSRNVLAGCVLILTAALIVSYFDASKSAIKNMGFVDFIETIKAYWYLKINRKSYR